LDLLATNYLSLDPGHLDTVDIFLFHTGDFEELDLDIIEPRVLAASSGSSGSSGFGSSSQHGKQEHEHEHEHNGIVKLVNLQDTPYWQLPHNLQGEDPSEWLDYHLFPTGYRHMCRFFAVKLWDFFETLNTQHGGGKHNSNNNNSSSNSSGGYRYIWRLDEDSFIHSKIPYNIFDLMSRQGYAYGYRLCSYELSHNKFVPHWFQKWHHKANPKRTIDWKMCGFYNNFFVADLSFFKTKRVQSFLYEIDRRGFLYRKRYGDLIVHSMAVYAFASQSQIHRFLDFTYEHVTVDRRVQLLREDNHDHGNGNGDGCIIWGAIQAGYMDNEEGHLQNTMEQFQRKFLILARNTTHKPAHRTNSSYYCTTTNLTQLTYDDLSPTYSHLSDQWKKGISLQTISAGKVELLNKGRLSG
jgi:hypothetical protein